MESYARGDPSFERCDSPESTRSHCEFPYPGVHPLNDVRSCWEAKIRVVEVRTVFRVPSDDLPDDATGFVWTRGIACEYVEIMEATANGPRIGRREERPNASSRTASFAEPPESLPRPEDIGDTPEEVGMAPLEHPSLRCGNGLDSTPAIAHESGNPSMGTTGNLSDRFPPPLL